MEHTDLWRKTHAADRPFHQGVGIFKHAKPLHTRLDDEIQRAAFRLTFPRYVTDTTTFDRGGFTRREIAIASALSRLKF